MRWKETGITSEIKDLLSLEAREFSQQISDADAVIRRKTAEMLQCDIYWSKLQMIKQIT